MEALQQRMKASMTTLGIMPSLPAVFLASLIMICTGCTHPRGPIRGTYTIENQAGLPFLVPSLDSLHTEGNIQTVLISLKDGPLSKGTGEHCSVASAFFGLFPKRRVSNQWEYHSPTASGWAQDGDDIYEDWKIFVRRLASSQYSGCFSTEEDVFSTQRMLAAATSLPATEIDAFLYSNDKAGYVDLAPGMEVLVRAKPKPEDGLNRRGSDIRLRIEARKTGGVQIKKVSASSTEAVPDRDASDWHIVSSYASVRLVRLFLQGISDYDSQHNPLLLGASDLQSLDAATRSVQTSGRTSCAGVRGPVICAAFPNGASVSLFIPVWVNGRRAEYPLGTHLGLILGQLPGAERPSILESVRVDRSTPNGGFARIIFPKTSEGVIQVVLVAGDRISWSLAAR
jgi:hypothetical protein